MDNNNKASEFLDTSYCFSGFESIFAWICLLLGYLFCRAFPLPDNPLGMFIIILVALCVTSAVLFKKSVKICASALTSAVLCVVFGAGMFISADAFAQFCIPRLGAGLQLFRLYRNGKQNRKRIFRSVACRFCKSSVYNAFQTLGQSVGCNVLGKEKR